MEGAVWACVGDSVPYVAALLLAVYVFTAVYVALLDGLRVDRWRAFSSRGVIQGLTKKDRSRSSYN
jgi:hypothetical protein